MLDLTAVDPWVWIVAAVVVVALLAVLIVVVRKKRRRREETRRQLKHRFGPEYDRTLGAARNRKTAEEDLLARERRRQTFTIRPVPAELRDGLQTRWDETQAGFVDAPNAALRQADELLDEVATARGYPDASREQRLADLSVDHPAAIERYCSSRPDDGKDQSTEQLREALLAARDLFETMLNRGEYGSSETPPTPFQELVKEPATEPMTPGDPLAGETSARSEVTEPTPPAPPAPETIDLTPHDGPASPHDRPREHVDTGGMPVVRGEDDLPPRDRG